MFKFASNFWHIVFKDYNVTNVASYSKDVYDYVVLWLTWVNRKMLRIECSILLIPTMLQIETHQHHPKITRLVLATKKVFGRTKSIWKRIFEVS